MKRLALLALAAASLFAQQPAPAPPPPLASNEVIRVVDVKNANANAIRINLEKIFPGITESNGHLIIRGQAPVVDLIEDAIKKLDAPPPEQRPAPNVELTIQLLQGSAQESGGGAIPADLEPTVRQLRNLFPYKSYKLLDTQLLRARSGSDTNSNGTLPGGNSMFQFRVRSTVNTGPAPRSVRLSNLYLSVKQQATGGAFYDAAIGGEFDAKEGQKTVIGKANIVNTEDAIILVITPKVIE